MATSIEKNLFNQIKTAFEARNDNMIYVGDYIAFICNDRLEVNPDTVRVGFEQNDAEQAADHLVNDLSFGESLFVVQLDTDKKFNFIHQVTRN